MRLVIDLQACQGFSGTRGIGRYSISLAKPMIEIAVERGHEVWLLITDSLLDNSLSIIDYFAPYVPKERMVVLPYLGPVACNKEVNRTRARMAEKVRAHIISILNPDVVHTASVFEGWIDDVVGVDLSKKESFISIATFYDLIPLLNAETYLSDPDYRKFYYNRLQTLTNMDLLLAISESSRLEAIEHLGFECDQVVNISAAVDTSFRPRIIDSKTKAELLAKYNVTKDIVLYVPGGFDPRKNFELLFEAFANLSESVKAKHQLVIASLLPEGVELALLSKASEYGLSENEVIFTGYVLDAELVALYNLCKVKVFPSLHEGFGLPVLEAMACGAAVIASNTTSLPEVVGYNEALFDPNSAESLSSKLTKCLTNESYLHDLRKHAKAHAATFSWERSARITLDALEKNLKPKANLDTGSVSINDKLDEIALVVKEYSFITAPSESDLEKLNFRLRNV